MILFPHDHEPPRENGPPTGIRPSARKDWRLAFRPIPSDVCIQKSEYVSVSEVELPAPDPHRRVDAGARAVVVRTADETARFLEIVVLQRREGHDGAERLAAQLDARAEGAQREEPEPERLRAEASRVSLFV